MAKLKTNRGYCFVKELGGAMRAARASFASRWLVENKHVRGRVLDFGCGFGRDAETYGWDAYDPHYRQAWPQGSFDTIVCNHVLNMLTRQSRGHVLAQIQNLLSPGGVAWLIVSRNLPTDGKIAMRHRIQNFVVLHLPTVYEDKRLTIYRWSEGTPVRDQTNEIERRLTARSNRRGRRR